MILLNCKSRKIESNNISKVENIAYINAGFILLTAFDDSSIKIA